MGGVHSAFSCTGACWRMEISRLSPAGGGLLLPGDYSRQMQRLAATMPREYSC